LPFHFDQVSCEIQAENLHAPGAWGHQSGQHLDSRGFAGAVWSEKAIELPWRDREVYVLNCSEIAETARDTFGENSRAVHKSFEFNTVGQGWT